MQLTDHTEQTKESSTFEKLNKKALRNNQSNAKHKVLFELALNQLVTLGDFMLAEKKKTS